jgi:S1-C subfamily serine protease
MYNNFMYGYWSKLLTSFGWFILMIIAVSALIVAILAYTKGITARDLLVTPTSPNLLCLPSNDVQSALARLNQPANLSSAGLMTAEDKARLNASPYPNGSQLVYQNAHCATVTVITTSGSGSGFVRSVNASSKHAFIMTAAHVVLQGGGTTLPLKPETMVHVVLSGANGDPSMNVQVPCMIVGLDAAADVAVIRTMSTTDHFYGFNFSQKQAVLEWSQDSFSPPGSEVLAIGNPQSNDLASVSSGVVRDGKYVPSMFGSVESVYTSAPITSGNSGGCFLNSSAKVIGLSNWVFASGTVPLTCFSGGVNAFMAERIERHIMEKNTDFNGINGKGYFGVEEVSLVAGRTLQNLRLNYPKLTTKSVDGVLVQKLDTTTTKAFVGSRLGSATTPVIVNDILLGHVGGIRFGAFDHQFSPTRLSWFATPGSHLRLNVLRPSTNRTFVTTLIVDAYPPNRDLTTSGAF